MVIRTDEVINIVSTLSDESGLKVTVKESLKGGLLTGVICTLFGCLLGPIGFVIGGIIGGILAYMKSGKFKPVSHVIGQLDEFKKEQLAESVKIILNDLDVTDAVQLMVMLHGDIPLKTKILTQVTTFLKDQLQMAIL